MQIKATILNASDAITTIRNAIRSVHNSGFYCFSSLCVPALANALYNITNGALTHLSRAECIDNAEFQTEFGNYPDFAPFYGAALHSSRMHEKFQQGLRTFVPYKVCTQRCSYLQKYCQDVACCCPGDLMMSCLASSENKVPQATATARQEPTTSANVRANLGRAVTEYPYGWSHVFHFRWVLHWLPFATCLQCIVTMRLKHPTPCAEPFPSWADALVARYSQVTNMGKTDTNLLLKMLREPSFDLAQLRTKNATSLHKIIDGIIARVTLGIVSVPYSCAADIFASAFQEARFPALCGRRAAT